MYVGKIVEMAETEELFVVPQHPYTEALLSAVPNPNPEIKMDRIILPGEIANPADPPPGCHFHPRCRFAQRVCAEEEPAWVEVRSDHFCHCHFGGKLSLRGAQ